jgi:hypothetical protein
MAVCVFINDSHVTLIADQPQIRPMSKTNVGAYIMFALRTKIVCEPMPEANVSNSLSNIGLIPVFVRGEHKVRPDE